MAQSDHLSTKISAVSDLKLKHISGAFELTLSLDLHTLPLFTVMSSRVSRAKDLDLNVRALHGILDESLM